MVVLNLDPLSTFPVEVAEDMTVVVYIHLCIPEVDPVDPVDMTAVECRHLYILETVAEDTDLVAESVELLLT